MKIFCKFRHKPGVAITISEPPKARYARYCQRCGRLAYLGPKGDGIISVPRDVIVNREEIHSSESPQ